ncbi:MAG TPA: FeoA family protein [Longimicrobiaceae bacterium]|nr:FeoA family protein [Longimicrobiaceae bacterium]
MVKQWFSRRVRKDASVSERCAACPLATCVRGSRAAVLRMDCDGCEADRLRTLGLFEGACVTVLNSQNGLLLEVRGARLALGSALAAGITVLPLAS